MKITGSGIDIVNISRFDGSSAQRFSRKVLTDNEIDYCSGKSSFILHMSGRVAAKEALFKALSSSGILPGWKDIEILSEGAPCLSTECRAYALMKEKKLSCSISISHDKGYAVAQALVWSG